MAVELSCDGFDHVMDVELSCCILYQSKVFGHSVEIGKVRGCNYKHMQR